MQLGIRMHDTKNLPIEERLQDIHELGFKCGHLALGKVGLPGDNGSLTPGYAMYLRQLFEKNQVAPAVLGCYLNLANPDKEQLQKITSRYMANIRFAAHLGAGVVGTETGSPNTTYTFVPETHSEEALETFITNLRPVVEYAEKMGVIMAIEPVYKHIVCNAKRARRVLDEINSPNLQIIFDPVNLLDVSNYQDREAIFKETIELLGEDIAMIHLKDFVIEDGKMVSVGCGLGQMNYDQVLTFIKIKKPYIHVTLENTTPENNQTCKAFIQNRYDQIIVE